MGLIGERSERLVAHVDAIAITAEFCPRRGVLQVVLAAVLGHPGPFDEGAEERIVVGLAETLPAMHVIVEPNQFLTRSNRLQRLAVNFPTIDRKLIA